MAASAQDVERAIATPAVPTRTDVVCIGLLAADVAGVVVAFAAAGALGAALLVAAPLWLAGAGVVGLYGGDRRHIDHSTFDEVGPLAVVATITSWALLLVAGPAERTSVVVFWAVAFAAAVAGRGAVRTVLRRRPALRQRVVLVGDGATARLVERKLLRHPEYGIDLVRVVSDDDVRGLARIVGDGGVDRVIVASEHASRELCEELGNASVHVDVVPAVPAMVIAGGVMHTVEDLPLIDLPPIGLARTSRAAKRLVDVAGALAGLVLTAPLFVVVPLLIRLETPGPAFFRQRRLGEGMQTFTMLKFRTMRDGVDDAAHRDYIARTMDAHAAPETNGLFKLQRAGDITRLGAFLRRTSLDELPQLVNILRGDMSLVGPRPCLAWETKHFAPHHFERFLVPAGLTGLWQVTARAHATFGEALDMDVAYARGWSPGLDFVLVLRTVKHLLTRKGTA
jgi:exopolysaccharide biosynthesis polyprenyl glycosylphosphotransferase